MTNLTKMKVYFQRRYSSRFLVLCRLTSKKKLQREEACSKSEEGETPNVDVFLKSKALDFGLPWTASFIVQIKKLHK